MKNDHLTKLWEMQAKNSSNLNPQDIITEAKKQRNGQYISISVMSLTVVILIIYAFYYAFNQWNTFNLGLILMISSLTFRIILEFYSLYRKERQLLNMSQKAYHNYLKKYYKTRQLINYVITPLCITVYTFGFYMLLPYFKEYFSNGFYTYIKVSGLISLLVIIAIIIKSTVKEHHFLKRLNRQ